MVPQWSNQGLPDDHPQRRVTKSHAVRTVQEAPNSLDQQGGYPKLFKNREKLPLRSPNNTLEFPLLSWTQWRSELRAGITRLFFSPDKNTDHIDVGYHDPRRGRNKKRNMSLGVYHSISQEGALNTKPRGDSSRLGSLGDPSVSGKMENTGSGQES